MKRFLTSARALLTAWLALCAPAYAAAATLGGADEIALPNATATPAGVRGTLVAITREVLSYVALAAIIVIIIAGIWLILGLGEDSAKEKAKKIVIYAIIGLVLILAARAIVVFIIRIAS